MKTRQDLTHQQQDGTPPFGKGKTLHTRFTKDYRTATIFAILFSALPTQAMATLFDTNIAITGSATFSGGGSSPAAATNASQSGTLTQILGGASTTTSLNGTAITGTDPLAGTLTDIGDGFGISFNASGTFGGTGTVSEIDELFGDYAFTLKNNSATDTFTVNLKLTFDNLVNALGSDAFAQSFIRIADAGNNEQFFSMLSSDSFNGNTKFVFPDGINNVALGSGGTLTDAGPILLSFVLAPGALVNLGDNSFELNVDGGAFQPGFFNVAVSTLLTVDSVVKQGTPPPNPISEPQTFLQLLIGFLMARHAMLRKPTASK